jgi:hypothetical protein
VGALPFSDGRDSIGVVGPLHSIPDTSISHDEVQVNAAAEAETVDVDRDLAAEAPPPGDLLREAAQRDRLRLAQIMSGTPSKKNRVLVA